MTLAKLRQDMSVVEMNLQAKFHAKKNQNEGQWRLEYMLATLIALTFNLHSKKKTSPADWLPDVLGKAKKPNYPTPMELAAWADRVNEKVQ